MRNMIFRPVFPVYIVLSAMTVLLLLRLLSLVRAGKPARVTVAALVRMLVLLAVLFCINLRPMIPDRNVKAEMKNVDVLFAIDTTISMWALDYNGSYERMSGVLKDCRYIMDRLYGANFALVRFDNQAQVLSPFTQDTKNVEDALSTILAPDENYAKGSDLSVPYHEMETLIASSRMKEDRKTAVFFISDGEITNGADRPSFTAFAKDVDGGAVLGYGTTEGGRMRLPSGRAFMQDPATGNEAISVLNEENLRALAADMEIDYIHMTDSSQVDVVLEMLSMIGTVRPEKTNFTAYRDLYPYLTFPFCVLLALELLFLTRKSRI